MPVVGRRAGRARGGPARRPGGGPGRRLRRRAAPGAQAGHRRRGDLRRAVALVHTAAPWAACCAGRIRRRSGVICPHGARSPGRPAALGALRSPWVVRGAGCAIVALAVAGAAAAITASSDRSSLEALARALIVGVPTAVGLGTISRTGERPLRAAARGAGRSAAAGDARGPPTTSSPTPSAGSPAGWSRSCSSTCSCRSRPAGSRAGPIGSGRGDGGGGARDVPAAARARGALRVPSPYTSCVGDCPANAFFVLDHRAGLRATRFMRPGGRAARSSP